MSVLLGATVVTALEAELVSGALAATASGLVLTPFFLGITVLAIVGKAAEYVSAMYFARQNRMELVLSITHGGLEHSGCALGCPGFGYRLVLYG